MEPSPPAPKLAPDRAVGASSPPKSRRKSRLDEPEPRTPPLHAMRVVDPLHALREQSAEHVARCCRLLRNVTWRPLGDDATALVATLGAELDHVLGGRDDRRMVLDH